MKMFEKVLEKFGIFSKEFEESLSETTQEEREKSKKLWEDFKYVKEQKIAPNTTTSIATEAFNNLISETDTLLQQKIAEGKKFDTGKLSYTLLPFPAITEVVHILEFGKQKYGRDNWKKVPNAKERYLDACFRHLISYIEGETKDHESGRHHLAHAVCCLLFALWFDLKEKV
jgi:hypothetical protein